MKEKIFRNWISNFIIVICITCVFGICFNPNIQSVTSSTSEVEAIYRGNALNKKATLMINVYWGTEYLDEMLETLDEYGVKTTFFVGGLWVSKEPEMLKKIYEIGHEIANHGFYHKDHDKIGEQRNREEIEITHKLVKETIGVDMNLFAPPSGAYNDVTLNVANSLGYRTIMWSKDTIDWRDQDENLIISRATKSMSNGDLILMHPTKATKNALKGIIENYKNAGFELVTVSENLA